MKKVDKLKTICFVSIIIFIMGTSWASMAQLIMLQEIPLGSYLVRWLFLAAFLGSPFYGLLGIALIVLLTICCFKMQKEHIWSYILILISVICDVIFEITILISQYTILIGPPKKIICITIYHIL